MQNDIFIGFRLSNEEMLAVRGGYIDLTNIFLMYYSYYNDKPKHQSEPIVLPPTPPIKI